MLAHQRLRVPDILGFVLGRMSRWPRACSTASAGSRTSSSIACCAGGGALPPRTSRTPFRQERRGTRRDPCSNRTAIWAASSRSRSGDGTRAPRRWRARPHRESGPADAFHVPRPSRSCCSPRTSATGVAAADGGRRVQAADRRRLQAAAAEGRRRVPAGAGARASAAIPSRTRASCSSDEEAQTTCARTRSSPTTRRSITRRTLDAVPQPGHRVLRRRRQDRQDPQGRR